MAVSCSPPTCAGARPPRSSTATGHRHQHQLAEARARCAVPLDADALYGALGNEYERGSRALTAAWSDSTATPAGKLTEVLAAVADESASSARATAAADSADRAAWPARELTLARYGVVEVAFQACLALLSGAGRALALYPALLREAELDLGALRSAPRRLRA